MKSIGILVAMEKEYDQIRSLLTSVENVEVSGRRYVVGAINGCSIILHICGIGKVNAAIGTTLLISHFHPDAVISSGCAGGVGDGMNIEDIVVSKYICYHDVWCGPETQLGQIQGSPNRWEGSKQLVEVASKLSYKHKIHCGLIASGDWFVDTREKAQSIKDANPDAMAIDMESGSIAQTCFEFGVPFISFRVISDLPLSDNNTVQYNDFWSTIAEDSFSVTKNLIDSLVNL